MHEEDVSISYLRNLSTPNTVVGSYAPPLYVTVTCVEEQGEKTLLIKKRGLGRQKREIWERRKEEKKRRQFSGI